VAPYDSTVLDNEQYLAAVRRALRLVASVGEGDSIDDETVDRLGQEGARVLSEATDGVPFDQLTERVGAEVAVWASLIATTVDALARHTQNSRAEILSQLEDVFIDRWGDAPPSSSSNATTDDRPPRH
jgi:hypothetical protein